MTRQAISHDRRPGRDRPVQPGDRQPSGFVFCSRPDRARPGDRRARRRASRPRPSASLRNLAAVLDAAGLRLARRREDDDLPGRHRPTSRRSTRSTRAYHGGPAAGPLDVRRRRRCRRARWSRSRRSPAAAEPSAGRRTRRRLTPGAGYRDGPPSRSRRAPGALPRPVRRGAVAPRGLRRRLRRGLSASPASRSSVRPRRSRRSAASPSASAIAGTPHLTSLRRGPGPRRGPVRLRRAALVDGRPVRDQRRPAPPDDRLLRRAVRGARLAGCLGRAVRPARPGGLGRRRRRPAGRGGRRRPGRQGRDRR